MEWEDMHIALEQIILKMKIVSKMQYFSLKNKIKAATIIVVAFIH